MKTNSETEHQDIDEKIDRTLRSLIDDIADIVRDDASSELRAVLYDYFDGQYADYGELREPPAITHARAVADPDQSSDLTVLTEQAIREAEANPESSINDVERERLLKNESAYAYVLNYDDEYIRLGNADDIARHKAREARYSGLTLDDIDVLEAVTKRAEQFYSSLETIIQKSGADGNQLQFTIETQASRAWAEVARQFDES